ncbi:MAG: alpha/beta hydrolase [Acidimicrobiales bacterium]
MNDEVWHALGVPVVSLPTSSSIQLAADHWSGDRTPVVLAHGGGQTRHSWGQTAAVLAGHGHEVLSIDLRGHGDSGWAGDGDYQLEAFADDALSVIEWLDRSVIWVGASLGGLTGLLASARPGVAMEAIVLVDITPQPAPTGVDRILSFMGSNAVDGFETLEDVADAIAAYQPHRPRRSDLSGLEKNLRRGDDGRWRWHWDPAFLTSRQSVKQDDQRYSPVESAARALEIPTLLIRGRQSDLVTETEARAFLEMVPHAGYVDVVDAAHMVAGDKNDIFTSAVVDFIEGV